MPRIRQLLLGVLVLGMAGSLTDLLLLKHYEDPAQFIPLALLVGALLVALWHARRPTAPNLRALQALMVLFLMAGATGIALHFDSAAEFQREIDPSIAWWLLVQKVARSQSPPLLGPGAMLQLGLLGLVYSFRHPTVSTPAHDDEER